MKFAEIPGNRKLINQLIVAIDQGRVPHAQLIIGPEGIGKLMLAMAYAQYLNCTNRIKMDSTSELIADSCGECPSCKKISILQHPDLHFALPTNDTQSHPRKNSKPPPCVDFLPEWREFVAASHGMVSLNSWYDFIGIENKQGYINVDDINNLSKVLSYKGSESQYKILIIWMAEKIFHLAAPKILKALEEPPPNTVFLLITEDQEMIINTIRSRTQLLKMERHSLTEASDFLQRVSLAGEDLVRKAVYYSQGNLVKGIQFLENQEEMLQSSNLFINWMRACFAFSAVELSDIMKIFVNLGREKQKFFLSACMDNMSKSIKIAYDINEKSFFSKDEELFFVKFSKFIRADNLQYFHNIFEEAVYQVERNGNSRLIFMDTSINLHRELTGKH